MTFKDWLMKEVGTGTNSIAGFSRITLPLVTRKWPDEGKEKKKKKQPQVEE